MANTTKHFFLSLSSLGYWLLHRVSSLEEAKTILDTGLFFFGCARVHVFGDEDHRLRLDKDVQWGGDSALSELVADCHRNDKDPAPYIELVRGAVTFAEKTGRCAWRSRSYNGGRYKEKDVESLRTLLVTNLGDHSGDKADEFYRALWDKSGYYPGVEEVCNDYYPGLVRCIR